MVRKTAVFRTVTFAIGLLLLWSRSGLASETQTAIVGEIITAIGEARVHSMNGGMHTAMRGGFVRAGDSIETSVGGHVHIRFVDGGLVSVRPLSRLSIEEYRNADGLGPSAIKFSLKEGVIRSVTGRWGEADRERFRLNTPIAAIGIKGTDFVVKASAENTMAAVFSGAIVMAPLEGPCAQTLGPCRGEKAVELSAEMTGLMLEMQRNNGTAAPRLVPSVDLFASAARSVSTTQRRLDVANSSDIAEKTAVTDVTGAGAVTEAVNIASSQQSKPLPLLWLHNPSGWNVPADTISQRYESALAAGRKGVVGNLFITLYRDETVLSTFSPEGNSASFVLKQGSATYKSINGTAESLTIDGAKLDVDFSRSTFVTHIDLRGGRVGQTSFDAAGSIDRNGIMIGRQSGQSLVGAFGMDGRDAGYMFSKPLSAGTVSGLTLWGR